MAAAVMAAATAGCRGDQVRQVACRLPADGRVALVREVEVKATAGSTAVGLQG